MKAHNRFSAGAYRWLGILLAGWLACGSPNQNSLVIATAANMQFAMTELTEAFTAETGVACEAVIGSSGKLTAQIQEGAPFDILVSADLKYPRELLRNGFAAEAPTVYAYGRLVLWTVRDTLSPALSGLADPAIRHIALANPATAPYGAAALQVLQRKGLATELAPKLVYGESIAQTNQFITSAAAEVGFTALSVVRSPAMRDRGRWILIDPADYDPIAQGLVILNNRPGAAASARQFRDFLRSASARAILEEYGYDVPE
jgi:molybdate transport system substrate-binding protein